MDRSQRRDYGTNAASASVIWGRKGGSQVLRAPLLETDARVIASSLNSATRSRRRRRGEFGSWRRDDPGAGPGCRLGPRKPRLELATRPGSPLTESQPPAHAAFGPNAQAIIVCDDLFVTNPLSTQVCPVIIPILAPPAEAIWGIGWIDERANLKRPRIGFPVFQRGGSEGTHIHPLSRDQTVSPAISCTAMPEGLCPCLDNCRLNLLGRCLGAIVTVLPGQDSRVSAPLSPRDVLALGSTMNALARPSLLSSTKSPERTVTIMNSDSDQPVECQFQVQRR